MIRITVISWIFAIQFWFGFYTRCQSAEFSDKTFPNGFHTKTAVTQKGDSLDGIARAFAQRESVATKGEVESIADASAWRLLKEHGLIDSSGNPCCKNHGITNFIQFQKATDIPDARSSRVLFTYLSRLENRRLDSGVITSIVKMINEENYSAHANDVLAPGQVLLLRSASSLIEVVPRLQLGNIVARTNVFLGERQVTVYFMDDEFDPSFQNGRLAETANDMVFISLSAMAQSVKSATEFITKKQKDTLSVSYIRAFSGKPPLEIFVSKIKEYENHEFAHVLTTRLIQSGKARIHKDPPGPTGFNTTCETSGILGQIAGSDHPDIPISVYITISGGHDLADLVGISDGTYGKEYVDAGKLVLDQILRKLDYIGYLVQDRKEDRKRTLGGTVEKPKEKLTAADFEINGRPIPDVINSLKKSHYLDTADNIQKCPYLLDGEGFQIEGKYSAVEQRRIYYALISHYDPEALEILNSISTLPEDYFSDFFYERFLQNTRPEAFVTAAREIHKKLFGVDLPPASCAIVPDSVVQYVNGKYYAGEN